MERTAAGRAEMQMLSTRKLCLVFLAVAIVVGLAVAERVTREPDGPNVVLIVVDALRADHLGVYGYERDTSPNLDQLASHGVLFRNAYSSASMSKPALSSLLTSMHPSSHNALDEWGVLADQALTLTEVLKASGYRTVLYDGGNPYLAPDFHLDQGFDLNTRVIGARPLTDEFLRALPKLKRDKFFAYLHYMDVHTPYAVHDYNTLFKDEISTKLGLVWGSEAKVALSLDDVSRLGREDPDARASLIALYDGEIRSMDHQVQRVIDGLEEHGLLKDTLVIFTADHGEQLWDHDGFGHGNMLYEEAIRVPLMLLGNGLASADVTTRVRLIDVFPTLMETIGNDVAGQSVDGESLWPTLSGDVADRPVFSMLGSPRRGQFYYALIHEGMKLHYFIDGENVDRGLFDLESDPHERVNIAEAQPEAADSLVERLQPYIDESSKGIKETVELKSDLEDELKSLGYLQP
jgi:arylsulfatase A-like enzyme